MHKGHTAHVAGGGEARHVAHHAAAQRKEHRLAVAGGGQQVVEDQVQRRPVLVRFAVGQQHVADVRIVRRQRLVQRGTVQCMHRGVADDHRPLGFRQALPGRGVLQKASADQDVVA